MLRAPARKHRGFSSRVAGMPQYLEFASSQWNRVATETFSRRTLGAFPRSRSEPRFQKKVMKPRIISLRRGFFMSIPVITGATATAGRPF